ncbi:glycosyltransferase family 39 protein [Candidatus Sumerlaeota bacterium]|nr:glycosyltransferase family 39 protein [Candidatus Sumerlaeota bacterium]
MIQETVSSETCFGKSSLLRRFFLAGLFITFICLAFHHGVLGGVPHGWDAVAYYFQARIFAEGEITAPGTPFIDFFWLTNVINGYESRYAKYPPGWPLLLAPFMKLGIPELANALLAGLCAMMTALVAGNLFGRATSWISLFLMVLSPFYMFMGADYLSHTSCCAALMFVLLALIFAFEKPLSWKRSWKWGLAIGAGAGIAFLIRPYSAFLGIAGCFCIVFLIKRRRWKEGMRLAFGFLIACVIAFVIYLGYNKATTGSFLVTAYQRYNPDFSFLGEGGFHRASVFENVRANLPKIARGLAGHVWGGFLPDVWLLAVALLLGIRERETRALVIALLIFCAGHSLYYYFDFYYGPRLVFEALPWFVIVSARGIFLAFRFAASQKGVWKNALYTILFLLLFLNLVKITGKTYPNLIRYYSTNYCGQGKELMNEVRRRDLENAVVFLRTPDAFAFANLSHLNPIDLEEAPVLFARYVSHPPERLPAMISAFPRREYWILDVSYMPMEGVNDYADRFAIASMKWSELRQGSAR